MKSSGYYNPYYNKEKTSIYNHNYYLNVTKAKRERERAAKGLTSRRPTGPSSSMSSSTYGNRLLQINRTKMANSQAFRQSWANLSPEQKQDPAVRRRYATRARQERLEAEKKLASLQNAAGKTTNNKKPGYSEEVQNYVKDLKSYIASGGLNKGGQQSTKGSSAGSTTKAAKAKEQQKDPKASEKIKKLNDKLNENIKDTIENYFKHLRQGKNPDKNGVYGILQRLIDQNETEVSKILGKGPKATATSTKKTDSAKDAVKAKIQNKMDRIDNIFKKTTSKKKTKSTSNRRKSK